MTYNVSNYLPEQQGPILALEVKAYGQPTNVTTDYAVGDLVTAELFNYRDRQLSGALSYLEDARRDETTRANLAEQALDLKYQAVAAALVAPSWIVIAYTGTPNVVTNGTQFVFQTGEAFVAGNLVFLPTPNYSITFPTGIPQVVMAHQDGTLTAVSPFTPAGSSDLVVGQWSGSDYTAVATTRYFTGSQPTVYTSDLSTQGNLAATGTLSVGSNTTLGGTLAVAGATTIGGTAAITGNTQIGGSTQIGGNTQIGQNLSVGGDTTLAGTLQVTGTTTIGGNVVAQGTLALTSNASIGGTLTVGQNAAFNQDVTITGSLTVLGNTTTVKSTVVDFADRILHVNDNTSTSTPVLSAGLSVHRGVDPVTSTNRPHGALIWSENNGVGLWTATFSPDDNSAILAGQEVDLRGRALTLTNNLVVGGDTALTGTLTTQNAITTAGPISVGIYAGPDQLIINRVGSSPNAANVTFGDGTGWKFQIKNRAFTPLVLLEVIDTGTVNIPGTLTAGQFNVANQTTSGNQNIGGNLTVTGTTTLNGSTTINAATAISGSNPLSVGGLLTVGGTTTLGNTLTVSMGGMAVTGGVTLSGNTSITSASTLTVGTGATTLGGTLAVTGDANFHGNMVVQGNLTVGGAITEIESTVINMDERLLHLNVTHGTAPAPSLPTGLLINRGNDGTTDRPSGSLIWFENGGLGKWIATFIPADDNATFVAGQEVDLQARTITATHDLIVAGNESVTGSMTVQGAGSIAGNVTLGSGNTDITYEVGASLDIDTRSIQTQFNGAGTLASMSEVNGATPVKVTSFSYDSAGNISNVTVVAGGKTVIKTYTYDPNGILVGMTKSVT